MSRNKLTFWWAWDIALDSAAALMLSFPGKNIVLVELKRLKMHICIDGKDARAVFRDNPPVASHLTIIQMQISRL